MPYEFFLFCCAKYLSDDASGANYCESRLSRSALYGLAPVMLLDPQPAELRVCHIRGSEATLYSRCDGGMRRYNEAEDSAMWRVRARPQSSVMRFNNRETTTETTANP